MKGKLYLLGLGVLGITTTEFSVIGILPQLAAAFRIGTDRAGWLLSAFALVIALFGPFMVSLFSGLNRKHAMVMALGVFAVSTFLSACTHNFYVLLCLRMLPAFLHPVFWSIALTIAIKSVPEQEAPRAAGIVFGGFTIASVLGVPLTAYMATLFSWKAAFLLCGGVNVLSMLGLWVLMPSMPVGVRQSYGAQLAVLKSVRMWRQFVLACLMIAAMYATYGYFSVYLKEVTGMNEMWISVMLLLFGVVGIGGNWLSGRLLSRSMEKTTLGFILLLGGVLGLVYFFGGSIYAMVGVVLLWGFVHTGGFLISNMNVISSAPEAPEFISSVFTSCGNLAVTIGTTAGGMVIVYGGVHAVVWVSLGLLGGAFLVGVYSNKRRTSVEQASKNTRSGFEQHSNSIRTTLEQHSKKLYN
ncbi:MFS transporter [[Flexibacter] sp. ATCC 35208]|uniref:MFS transporter n=1 Tax=[Flexibacter] sp. ATCC 35208 TaxID=1936242 RepID=UPI0009D1E4A1|nr:MFS transporter [[Flexibacter] sp. ATCC 35208]OMP76364.1 hypothetical protein BW716_25575 [[Flexibacter] sp. ATCC 35208]